MGTISEAIEVKSADERTWRAYADPDHQSITGMFGGWTTAVALASVMNSSTSEAVPAALTINFIGSIEPGNEVEIRTSLIGSTRSLEHWNTTVHSGGSVHAAALVVLANRRETEPHLQPVKPEAPDPSTLDRFEAPPPQGKQTEMYPVGPFAYGSGDSRSAHWLRDSNSRPLDHLLLAYLADQYAPRSFFWGVGIRPSATLTMSVYFHATADELASVGTDFILNEATGTRGEQSTSGQQARLWSRKGALLATTEQLAWYR
ncbi:MAG TPA: thioesterase family protein [Aeromicrobium sp.]|nr:thioesterase family protein [Aeromicrobium sp.]